MDSVASVAKQREVSARNFCILVYFTLEDCLSLSYTHTEAEVYIQI